MLIDILIIQTYLLRLEKLIHSQPNKLKVVATKEHVNIKLLICHLIAFPQYHLCVKSHARLKYLRG